MSTEIKTPTTCENTQSTACCPARNERVYQPAADVRRSKDAIVIEAELPGVDAANLSVDLENDTMTISGATTARPSDAPPLQHVEWVPGRYQRSFKLGPQVDREQITAEMKHGLLTLTLPLKQEAQPKAIRIEVNGSD